MNRMAAMGMFLTLALLGTYITLKEANNLLTDTYGGTLTLAAHTEEQNVNIYTEHPLLSVVTPTNVPFTIKRDGKVIIIEEV